MLKLCAVSHCLCVTWESILVYYEKVLGIKRLFDYCFGYVVECVSFSHVCYFNVTNMRMDLFET